jgi:glycosyltransferase involved in cell wall biosynthesis
MVLKNLLFNRPYLIHTHSTFPSGLWGIVAGKILRIKVIVSLDAAEASGLPEIKFGDMLGKKRKFINKWVINQADEVIVLTEFLLNEVKSNLKIDRSFHVIPRGVDTDKFKFNEKEISHPLKIINVAYLNPVKDQHTLLKCFTIISSQVDSILSHLGEDFHSGEIQQKVKQMGLENRVKFLGLIANNDLPQYYHDADILLHTSLYESQAVVVNEAMASGVLVCGTHVGLLADLADVCCITVKPGDAEGLAQRVLKLINDREQVFMLRRKAYDWAVTHNLEWTIQQHRSVYENV